MLKNALVVIGSRTAENCYGIESGLRVAAALSSRGWTTSTLHASCGREILAHLLGGDKPDIVVPVGFGPPAETGDISAASRLAGIPCAGPTPITGNLAQDKAAFSRLVSTLFPPGSGVRSPIGFSLSTETTDEHIRRRAEELRVPVLVKPNFSGSSEGLLDTLDICEALDAAKTMAEHEGKVLIQELEQHIRHEISITILDTADGPRLLPIVELRRDDIAFMGKEQKFEEDALDRHIIPARLDPSVSDRVEQAALTIRRELGPVGLSRIDALVLDSGEIVILELNGIAGLLPTSIACDAAQAAGMEFADLAEAYAATAFIARPEPSAWE